MLKNPFKRMKTYACYKCGHVLQGEPSKIIPKDNFTNGPYKYCGPCSPKYDYVKYEHSWETSNQFGVEHVTNLVYYRDKVLCDKNGEIKCCKCDESNRVAEVLSKELMTREAKKKKRARKSK